MSDINERFERLEEKIKETLNQKDETIRNLTSTCEKLIEVVGLVMPKDWNLTITRDGFEKARVILDEILTPSKEDGE